MTRSPLVGLGCVFLTLALVLVPPAPAARAESVPDKVDPALRALMQERPLSLGATNVNLANAALDLLRLYGTPVAGLALIDSAAGFANAPGIEAISLTPTVAYVHLDATVVPALDPLPTPTPPPTPPPPLPTPTP